MPTPIDPKRLPGLKAALATFGDDDKISHQDLAKLYGVTSARLTTLIKNRFKEFPPADKHGDKTHWYPAAAAVTAMIAYMEGSGKAKRAAATRAAAVMGRATEAAEAAPAAVEEPIPFGPVEMDRLASASTRIWRLAVEQAKFVPASDMRHAVRTILDMVKREITQLPHAIDPNGELSPLHRARLEAHCRETLVKLHDEMESVFADEGTGRASSAAA